MPFESVQIEIAINGGSPSPGWAQGASVGDTVEFSLSNTTGVNTFAWELIGRPEGSAAGGAGPEPVSLGNAATASITLDVRGTYIVACTINAGAPNQTSKTAGVAILSTVVNPDGKHLRMIGPNETDEDNSDPATNAGWVKVLNRWLRVVETGGGGGGGGTSLGIVVSNTGAGFVLQGAAASSTTIVDALGNTVDSNLVGNTLVLGTMNAISNAMNQVVVTGTGNSLATACGLVAVVGANNDLHQFLNEIYIVGDGNTVNDNGSQVVSIGGGTDIGDSCSGISVGFGNGISTATAHVAAIAIGWSVTATDHQCVIGSNTDLTNTAFPIHEFVVRGLDLTTSPSFTAIDTLRAIDNPDADGKTGLTVVFNNAGAYSNQTMLAAQTPPSGAYICYFPSLI